MATVPPAFICELALGNNPGDSSYTWTDVSAYLRSFHISRGRQYELNAMQAGTCDIVLKNLDRRFEPGYASSPYYPNIRPMVPVRLRVANAKPTDAASPLTLSGNEILDSNRTAALSWTISQSGGQTDGLSTPAGVFIGRAATNLFRRGQCDTNTDFGVLAAGGTVTAAVDTSTAAPFSPQSIKVTTDGAGANQGVDPHSAVGQAAAAGTTGATSIYVKGVSGQSYTCYTQWNNTDASVTVGTTTTFTATGSWQLIIPAALAVATGKTGDALHVQVRVNGTRAESFWVAHAMLEKGQSVVAPYVATSGGTTATKNAARVQEPVASVDETTGSIVVRFAPGWSTSAMPGGGTGVAYLFDWRDDANNRLSGYFDEATKTFRMERYNGGSGSVAQSAAQTLTSGTSVTVEFSWSATAVGVRVNGGTKTTTANTNIPTLAATKFDLGATFAVGTPTVGANHCNGRIRWSATFSTVANDTDAATVGAISGNPTQTNSYYDHDASVLLWPSSATVTSYWPAITSAYRIPSDAILFTGYVERFPQNRTGPSYAETQIQAVDGFELLSNATLTGATYPSEVTGSRIGRVLDAVSWSTSARSIATGQSTIASYTFASTDQIIPLNHIQDVELSELGTFFITNDGRAKFQDRRSLGSTNSATFTDQPSVDTTAIGYADIVVSYDKDYIYNSWSGTRTGGTTQTVINSASITQYFLRSQSRTPLLTTDGDVQTQMQYLTATYAQPYLRVESITVTPGNNTSAWLQLLARDLTDRISVKEHPPGGGTTLVQDSYIQQIDLTVPTDPADTRLVYSLLPAATNNFWQASISAVGTDTRAGY